MDTAVYSRQRRPRVQHMKEQFFHTRHKDTTATESLHPIFHRSAAAQVGGFGFVFCFPAWKCMNITTGQMNSERCDIVIVWNACNGWRVVNDHNPEEDKSKIQHT